MCQPDSLNSFINKTKFKFQLRNYLMIHADTLNNFNDTRVINNFNVINGINNKQATL